MSEPDMFTIPACARVEWPSTRAWRLLWADTEDTPIFDAVAAVFGRVGAASRVDETSQPQGLGNQKGKTDGNKGGVHPDRTRRDAEGPDKRGIRAGSGVLDHSGPDPSRRRASGAGRRRGLSDATPVGDPPAGVTNDALAKADARRES